MYPLRKAVPFPNLMMPRARRHGSWSKHRQESGEPQRLLAVASRSGIRRKTLLTPEISTKLVCLRGCCGCSSFPDGNQSAMCQGIRRARVAKFVRKKLALGCESRAGATTSPARASEPPRCSESCETHCARSGNSPKTWVTTSAPLCSTSTRQTRVVDFAGSYLLKDVAERQKLLETDDIGVRVELALGYVIGELELAELGNEIQTRDPRPGGEGAEGLLPSRTAENHPA